MFCAVLKSFFYTVGFFFKKKKVLLVFVYGLVVRVLIVFLQGFFSVTVYVCFLVSFSLVFASMVFFECFLCVCF